MPHAHNVVDRAAGPADDPGPRFGDQHFDALYREWYPSVLRRCRRMLGIHRDAEAVAQEAFVRAWLSWDQFAADRPFWPWMATIARRLCLNELVADGRRDDRSGRASRGFMAPFDGEDRLERLVQSGDVTKALRALPPRQQRVLFLRHVEGWSYDELAGFEGVTIESIRSILKRARAGFRAHYERIGSGPLGVVAPALWRGLSAARNRLARAGRAAERWAGTVGRAFDPGATAAAAALLLGSASVAVAPSVPAGAMDGAIATTASAIRAPAAAANDSGGQATTPKQPTSGAADAALPTTPGTAWFDPAEGSGFTFTASPSYAEDHTVFATGSSPCGDASLPRCPLLLRSDDGGRRWTRLAAAGVDVRGAWRVLLPPAFPRDPRIFLTTGSSLQMSSDGGASFVALPFGIGGGRPRMSPRFSDGDPRFLSSDGRFDYRLGDALPRPLTLPLPPGTVVEDVAFAPSYAHDGRILVSTSRATLPTTARDRDNFVVGVYACSPTSCERASEELRNVPRSSFVAGADGTVYAYSTVTSTLHRSRDGGRTFTRLAVPDGVGAPLFRLLTVGADGRLFLVAHDYGIGGQALMTSVDGGESWTLVGAVPLVASDLLALPDGSLLAGAPAGITCSTDGGRTWAAACDRRAA